jgi:tRNA pseudouridine32 synthase / 23S rRNA pseudouridine746 synthase
MVMPRPRPSVGIDLKTVTNTTVHANKHVNVRPPTRHGVSPSVMALPPMAVFGSGVQPSSLLSYLELSTHIPPGQSWDERLKQGLVFDEQAQPLPVDAPYMPGKRIYYYRHIDAEPRIPFDEAVLYQDAHILVADKPHFLPVTPSGRYVQETLLVRLKQRTGLDDLAPLHRIDRDTAGLVLFSVQPATRGVYASLFKDRAVHKTYEAIAPYNAALPFPCTRESRMVRAAASFMQMQETSGQPNSCTQIHLLEQRGAWARYQLHPITGQRHQLRLHMLALGLPLLGDQIYPVLTPEPDIHALDYSQPLQLLAKSVAFVDPVTGEDRHFVSQLDLNWPRDLHG